MVCSSYFPLKIKVELIKLINFAAYQCYSTIHAAHDNK